MTVEQFNKKYKNYLEEGHYGLSLGDDEFIEWLDGQFEKFITYPGFKFTQIKEKFGMGRFYCDGLPKELINEVEDKISKL